MAFSDYGIGAVLNHLFEGSALPQPTLYVGLSLGDPKADGSGLVEPDSSAGYVRKRPDDIDGRWGIAGNKVFNKGPITFPEATADWGNVTHAALFDAEEQGNMLVFVELKTARQYFEGDTAVFSTAALLFTLT
jgi:hypothetical protein